MSKKEGPRRARVNVALRVNPPMLVPVHSTDSSGPSWQLHLGLVQDHNTSGPTPKQSEGPREGTYICRYWDHMTPSYWFFLGIWWGNMFSLYLEIHYLAIPFIIIFCYIFCLYLFLLKGNMKLSLLVLPLYDSFSN